MTRPLRNCHTPSSTIEGDHPLLCSEAILVNADEAQGHATLLRCKRWSCPLCNPVNHRRIKRAAREGRPNTFLTLTVNPSRYSTVDQAARDLKAAWLNVRRAMQRSFGIERPPFIAIFESTKTGWPHLHILMRCRFISQRWYSDQMKRLIGAPIVDVRFIQDVGRVAGYVAKYISKAPEAFAHCKRWWRSSDYAIDKEEPQPFRRFGPHVSEHKTSIAAYLSQTFRGTAQILELRDGYARWRAPEPLRLSNPPPSRMKEKITC